VSVRIAVITNAIPDYRYPVFKRLLDTGQSSYRIFTSLPIQRSCALARQHLPLRFSAGFNLPWTTRHAERRTRQRELIAIPWSLAGDLWRFRPQVIVSGDLGLRSLVCCLVARMTAARLVLWSEEIAASAVGRSRLQRLIRRYLARRADAFVAWGKPAAEYVRSLNVEESRIFLCAQAVDNDWWMRRAASLDRERCRGRLQLAGTVFLLVGRLVELKGFAHFLAAWAQIPAELHSRISAVIVGEGAQRAELEQLLLRHRLVNVRLAGARTATELASYYAAADVLVFPSLQEVWGLVVNEAMCFGLPVLGSCHAGATLELVAGTDAGEIFDPLDARQFVELLVRWASKRPAYDASHIRAAVGEVSIDRSVQGLQRAIDFCAPDSRPA
jgi:glycosyltransferase involved in cell wall biosynthesis